MHTFTKNRMKMDICCEQKRIREFLFFPTDLLNHNNKNGAGQTVQIIVFFVETILLSISFKSIIF